MCKWCSGVRGVGFPGRNKIESSLSSSSLFAVVESLPPSSSFMVCLLYGFPPVIGDAQLDLGDMGRWVEGRLVGRIILLLLVRSCLLSLLGGIYLLSWGSYGNKAGAGRGSCVAPAEEQPIIMRVTTATKRFDWVGCVFTRLLHFWAR